MALWIGNIWQVVCKIAKKIKLICVFIGIELQPLPFSIPRASFFSSVFGRLLLHHTNRSAPSPCSPPPAEPQTVALSVCTSHEKRNSPKPSQVETNGPQMDEWRQRRRWRFRWGNGPFRLERPALYTDPSKTWLHCQRHLDIFGILKPDNNSYVVTSWRWEPVSIYQYIGGSAQRGSKYIKHEKFVEDEMKMWLLFVNIRSGICESSFHARDL